MRLKKRLEEAINDWLLRFDEISVFERKGTPKSFILSGRKEMNEII